MIAVSGFPVSPADVAALPEPQRTIFRMKERSPVTYRYDSLNTLLFELNMRANIVRAARALNQSGPAFAGFDRTRCNPRYWTRTEEGGCRLNFNVTPADAIRDIFVNGHLYAFECAMAVVIVLYRGALDTMGDAAFNRYFRNLYLHDWNYDSDLRLRSSTDTREAYPGDVLYFNNPDFSPQTPEWRGENAILLEDGLFYGHGIGITTADHIISELNRHRFPGSTTSAHLMDLVVYPDYAYLSTYRFGSAGAERIVARIGDITYAR